MGATGGFLRWLGTMLLALLVSMLAGSTLCVLLGIAFAAREELAVAFVMLALASLLTSLVLVPVALAARRPRPIDLAAVLITVASALGLLAIAAGEALQDGGRDSFTNDLPLFAETMLPIAGMVIVQWFLVRRRWIREHSA